MQRAIDETNRRRSVQLEYNKTHNITPKTIYKDIRENFEITKKADVTKDIALKEIPAEIEKLKGLLKYFSAQMDYERCIEIRDTIAALKKRLPKN